MNHGLPLPHPGFAAQMHGPHAGAQVASPQIPLGPHGQPQLPGQTANNPAAHRPAAPRYPGDTRGHFGEAGAGQGAAGRSRTGAWNPDSPRNTGSRIHGFEVRSPALPGLEDPEEEGDIPLSILLPEPDPRAALKEAIDKEHDALMDDLRRLREERKGQLLRLIRTAVEKKELPQVALLNEMFTQVDTHFQELQTRATWIAVHKLEALTSGNSSKGADEVLNIRRQLTVLRRSVRAGVRQAMREASEFNCSALLGLLAECQANMEDNLYIEAMGVKTSAQRDKQALLDKLEVERARVRAFLHKQMRRAREYEENGLWDFLADLLRDVENRYIQRRCAIAG